MRCNFEHLYGTAEKYGRVFGSSDTEPLSLGRSYALPGREYSIAALVLKPFPLARPSLLVAGSAGVEDGCLRLCTIGKPTVQGCPCPRVGLGPYTGTHEGPSLSESRKRSLIA